MNHYTLCISKQRITKKERGTRNDSSYEKLTGYIIDNELPIEPNIDGFIHLDENNFDLFTILGDILATTNKESTIAECLGKDITIQNKDRFSFVYDLLQQTILANHSISLDRFDEVCSYLHTSIKYNVSIDSNDSMYEDIVLMDDFSYKFNNFESFKENANPTNLLFTYSCKDIIDIVLSIIHFLSRYDYQFYKCPICDRYTLHLKKKGRIPTYCSRKGVHNLDVSPNYTCGEAVNAILDNTKKNRQNIKSNLASNHPDVLIDFLKSVDKAFENFKSTHSKENLIVLANTVNKDAKSHWYNLKRKD